MADGMKVVSSYVLEKVADALDAEAEARDWSRSQMIRIILHGWYWDRYYALEKETKGDDDDGTDDE